MNKYTIVTTSGHAISLIAENFDRDPKLGRLAFCIEDSNVAMFELSNIAGFYIAAEEDER